MVKFCKRCILQCHFPCNMSMLFCSTFIKCCQEGFRFANSLLESIIVHCLSDLCKKCYKPSHMILSALLEFDTAPLLGGSRCLKHTEIQMSTVFPINLTLELHMTFLVSQSSVLKRLQEVFMPLQFSLDSHFIP